MLILRGDYESMSSFMDFENMEHLLRTIVRGFISSLWYVLHNFDFQT